MSAEELKHCTRVECIQLENWKTGKLESCELGNWEQVDFDRAGADQSINLFGLFETMQIAHVGHVKGVMTVNGPMKPEIDAGSVSLIAAF